MFRKLRDTYLCGCESDDGRQVFAFRGRKVPLLPEPALQLVRLCLAEQDAALAFLVHRSAVGRPSATRARRTGPVVFAARVVVVELVVHLVAVHLGRFPLAGPADADTDADHRSRSAVAAHADRRVGRQAAGRARRIGQVRDAGRRAVRARLLRTVTQPES